MSWLAFLGVLLAVSLINQKYWLPIQRSECLLNDAALCNLLFAYFVTSLIWLGVTIFLLALEALVTWLIPHECGDTACHAPPRSTLFYVD